MEIEAIHKKLVGREDENKYYLQNGVMFRHICKDCNSFLGAEYDPILNEFNQALSLYLRSKLIMPPYTYIKTKPVRIMKGILGHLLSVRTGKDNTLMDKMIKKCILEKDIHIPEEVELCYWIYPYDNTRIMRDFSVTNQLGNFADFCHCSIIKYFPVAFLISDKKDFRGLPNFSKFHKMNIDTEIELRVDLRRIFGIGYPEEVTDNNIVFTSEESMAGIIASPKPIKKK